MATPNEIIDITIRMTPMAFATQPIWCHISIRSICTSSGARKRSRETVTELPALLQREVHGDGHDDRHGDVVEQRRRELPLLDRIERRLIEERNRSQDLGVLHASVGADRRFD